MRAFFVTLLALLAASLVACSVGGGGDALDSSAVSSVSVVEEGAMIADFSSQVTYVGSYDGLGLAFYGGAGSRQVLDAFVAENHEGLGAPGRELLEGYDEAFFDKRALIVIAVDASSGSARLRVRAVTAQNGTVTVQVEEEPLDEGVLGTADLARFLIVVELPAQYGGREIEVIGGAV